MRSLYKTLLCVLLLASLAACSSVPQDTPRDPAERTREPGSRITATSLPPTPKPSAPASQEPTPAEEPTAEPEVPGETAEPEAPTPTEAAATTAGGVLYTVFDEATASTELWRYDLEDASERQLLTCADGCGMGNIVVSPDGGRVAFVSGRVDGKHGLYLADLAGGEPRQVIGGDVTLGHDAFSPDGSRLAFVLHAPTEGMLPPGSAYVVEVGGGEPLQVSPSYTGLHELSWLDDDTLIAAAHIGNSGLGATLRIAASGEQEPEELSAGRAIGLSPDRTKLLLAYYPFTDNSAADQRFAFRVLDLTTEQPQVLADLSLTMGMPIWSPDSARLLHAGPNTLQLIDLLTGREQLVQAFEGKHIFVSQPIWSHDGASIIYATALYGDQPATEIHQLALEDESDRVLLTVSGSVTPWLVAAP